VRFGRTLGLAIDFVRPPTGAAGVEFVAAAIATIPPTMTSGNAGTTVVIPKPTGTASGDLLLAVVSFADTIAVITPPSGWSLLMQISMKAVYTKTAGGGEPASYTWTCDVDGEGRSGIIITMRNGALGDFDSSITTTFPTVTALADGAAFLGFVAISAFTFDAFTFNAPLTDRGQHVAGGSGAYSVPQATGIATELGLSAGDVAGRTWSHPTISGDPASYSVILEFSP
jgi:hypothetical protein